MEGRGWESGGKLLVSACRFVNIFPRANCELSNVIVDRDEPFMRSPVEKMGKKNGEVEHGWVNITVPVWGVVRLDEPNVVGAS